MAINLSKTTKTLGFVILMVILIINENFKLLVGYLRGDQCYVLLPFILSSILVSAYDLNYTTLRSEATTLMDGIKSEFRSVPKVMFAICSNTRRINWPGIELNYAKGDAFLDIIIYPYRMNIYCKLWMRIRRCERTLWLSMWPYGLYGLGNVHYMG